MASKKSSGRNLQNTPITDRSIYYTDLVTLPNEAKMSNLFCAQALFFFKMNSNVLVDLKKATNYRRNNILDIDSNLYRQMIDPPTPLSTGTGGSAAYFASDFKALPIATHLRNIRKAKLDKIGQINKPQVNEINKFSKSQRQKDKDKIIHQHVFRELITQVAKDLGLPPLSKSQTPEEYISKLQKAGQDNKDGQQVDDITRIMEQIKLQIKDDQDYALYERYVYKGEIERAFELGIQYYLIDQNKWRIVSQLFNEDLVNFNRACGQWYVDNTTGRPVVRYLDPARLYTSPFRLKDGDDMLYWFYEEPVPFSDFVRQFGSTLTDEQLKEVFLINKSTGGAHNLEWDCGVQRRNNAMIMVGYAAFLSQDSNDFAEVNDNNGNCLWSPQVSTWKPDTESAVQKKKIYNVWYSFSYIPPPGQYTTRNMQADWVWQSRYIFNIQKETDMFRFGVDRRYAKSSLVLWRDETPSCTDIEESIMPKIHTLWHKLQNTLVNDFSGVAIDEDFFLGVLNAVDESNQTNPNEPANATGSNGINAGLEAFRQMRQGGATMLKFRDKNGNVIPGMKPSDFFVTYDNKMLDKAEKYLQQILQQYELLKVMLAQSDVTEGVGAKPRTNELSIEASIEASNNAIWFVEFPVREFMIMYSERCVQYIINLVKDKKVYDYAERWDNFEQVVGLAQSLMIEGVAELAPEDIGITVSLMDTTAQQEFVKQLALQMVTNNQVGFDGAMLAIETASVNYKFAYALLAMFRKQKEEEAAQQAEYAHQQQMQLLQMQNQIAINLAAAKSQGTQQEIQVKGQVDNEVNQQLNQAKYQTQAALKAQNNEQRKEETAMRLQLEHNLSNQDSIIAK